jgi:CDP-diacylglycerol--serine O-phosphatidyltransferase
MNLNKRELSTRRGIYLLPNLLTTTALFAGFYAIIAAMNGYFDRAAMGIFIAMIMDGLDGRVARLLNSATAFGAEYDSLSDMVAFGVAPGLVVYHWALSDLGKFGWLCAFVYTACAALRLARFNTQLESADKRYFQGLPSPAAAGLVGGMVWTGADYLSLSPIMALIVALLTMSAALLMVSNIRYHSFKQFDFKGKIPFIAGLLIVLIFVLISIDPPWVLFSLFFFYALSGVVLTLHNLRKTRKSRREKIND